MQFVRLAGILSTVAAVGLAPTGTAADSKALAVGAFRARVLVDKAPDCSSLKTIVASVTRGCKTDDERAIALYNFMLLTHYHQGYPGEKGGLGALKEINVYGWSLCGGLHTIQAALWREMGWEWRYIGWSNPGHTTVEVRYGGRWHYLDVFLRFYAWIPDPDAPGGRTIASQEDLKGNPTLITDGLYHDRPRGVYYHADNRFEVIGDKANWLAPSFLSCGDEPGGILTGLKSSNRSGSPTGWAGLEFDSPGYSTDVDLLPGSAITLTWDAVKDAHWWNGRQAVPGHGCGDKDFRNCPVIGPIYEPYERSGSARRSYANGTIALTPDLTSETFLDSVAAKDNVKVDNGKLVPADPSRPGSVTVEIKSPYVMCRASGMAGGADVVEVSLDGKVFFPIKLEDFSEVVAGQYRCLVRVSFKAALTSLYLEAIVQCNRGSLPYLSPGRNRVTVSVADPKDLGDQQLVVTYAYQAGARSKSYEDLAAMDAELGRAHYATWSATPTVVQKIFSAKDLPATFDIDVATPKDKYPVYPRMLFLRREVIARSARPLPLPVGAAAPAVGPDLVLKELPNPFAIGSAKPPKQIERPTTTRKITFRAGPAISKEGLVADNHYLKWKNGETWALMVGGNLNDLPPVREIAAARLIVPVVHGHAKAATKLGVTLPTVPVEKDKPYSFDNLGQVVGTAIVPLQPGHADYAPAKEFSIDLTRVVKQIAAREVMFRGFGLRTVPDRSVDDGYITRLDIPTGAEIRLEVDIYDKK